MKLGQLTEQNLAEIRTLLASAGLVPVGLDDEKLHLFCHFDDSGRIAGVIGIEVYPQGGLLRSLAVRSDMRNKGIARSLINEVLQFARSIQLYDLYLLTETIGETMYRYGFRDIVREQVPVEILGSPFFNGICPCSCRLMHKNIREA